MSSVPTQHLALTAVTASAVSLAAAFTVHRLTQPARSPLSPPPPGQSASASDNSDDDNDAGTSSKKRGGKKGDKKGKGKNKKNGEVGEDSTNKRYDTKHEHYSATTGMWEDVPEDDSDPDSSDSEGEDEDGKKKKRRRKRLFTAVQRTWPKSSEFSGYEDYIALTLRSSRLIALLRDDVPGLRECEEVFEDKPSVDTKDLFLVLDELRKIKGRKEEEVEKREKEGEGQHSEEKEEGGKENEEEEEEEEEKESLVKRKEKPLDDLKEEIDHLSVLLSYIDELFEPTQAKLARLLHPPSPCSTSSTSPASSSDSKPFHPQISFPLLWAVFRPDSLAVAEHEVSGEKYALRVKSANYQLTRDGYAFVVSGTTLSWNGSKYVRQWVEERIPKFKSLRRLSSLPLQPLSPSSTLHRDLSERGKRYCELTGDAGVGGSRFLEYGGVLMIVTGCGMERRVVKLRAEGRAVVDIKSYRRMCPSGSGNGSTMWDDDDEDDTNPFLWGDPSMPLHPSTSSSHDPSRVSPCDLPLLPPTVFGFSLVQREWGEMLVESFEEIVFRKDAWERLVLEEETKGIVRGLVENNEAVRRAKRRIARAAKTAGMKGRGEGEGGGESEEGEKEKEGRTRTDIIDGKGGGLVIALHGMPGVGKTLTAESVAEALQVPLYTVGAGSLGVQADVLEKRLRDTLDIAETWGATLLIDEADVFLEARSLHDLQRNALVSVFLRLMEYHSGVLFLTTNRIRSIDEAFLSRFSLAITYPNLDKPKRKHIWRQFLELAGVGIAPSSSSSSPPSGSSASSSSYELVEGSERQEKEKKEYNSYVSAKYLDSLAGISGFNGRQIKNIIRTAHSLALSHRVPLGKTEIDTVVKASQAFVRDFEEADEKGVYEAPGEGWKDRTNIFN
ncbi:hypothetical protein JCM8547_003609 [Rhodosporidiobolus lusitaniae]